MSGFTINPMVFILAGETSSSQSSHINLRFSMLGKYFSRQCYEIFFITKIIIDLSFTEFAQRVVKVKVRDSGVGRGGGGGGGAWYCEWGGYSLYIYIV